MRHLRRSFVLAARLLLCLGLGPLGSGGSLLLAGDLVISEFMARNNSTLPDQDGDHPDWLEVYNGGTTRVDLGGYYLTDDPAELTKWRFPAVTIEPNAFLVVFASDKDRRNPAAELHTNFKLRSGGEFLALVEPDGVTPVWQYTLFPPQVEDFSYGLAQDAAFARLVTSGSPARVLVPADGGLGLSWTGTGFNDLAWRGGSTGVGYDRNATYRSLIGTDIGTAMDSVNTTAYIRVPFAVGDPSAFGGLVLRMKYDDGFVAYINGQRVASANAPASPAWNSASTGLHDDGDAVVFEEYSVSAAAGRLVAGTNILALHGLNGSLGSSDFVILPELDGIDSGVLDRSRELFFPQPTPGWGNTRGFDRVAEKPRVSPASTVFSGTLRVTLGASLPQTVLRYTLDGSEPTDSSPVYTAPISVTETTILRTRGFEPGAAPSPTVGESYLSLATNLRNFTSNLPIVVIDNFGGGGVPANSFQPAFLAIFAPPAGGRSALGNVPDLQSRIGIKIRGSSTAGRPKKAYSIEARDEDGEDRDIAPLGLPPESDWILYGAYNFDRALMRNALIYELSNQVGRYAARTRFCEVYVNTGGGALSSSDYVGVYSFMEKLKRGKERVDVERLTAAEDRQPGISGGYMLKIDRLDPGDSGLGAGGQRLAHVYPKEDRITPAQRTWIKNYIDTFVSTLNSSNFRDPVRGYARYIDVDSWVDHHILNVLPKNVDALRLSTYFFKRREGKLEFGPVWDFDRSMDSADGRDNDPRNWNSGSGGTNFFNYPWWQRLFQDAEFWQRWTDRWHEFRQGPLGTANVNAVIDSMAAEIAEAQVRDAAKWNQTTPSGWRSEVSKLKSWLRTRASWIDSQFLTAPRLGSPGRRITPGFQLTISAPRGTIHYTLDGTDPRRRGGAVAPAASVYSGAITLDETARVVARARVSNSEWSAPVAATFYTAVPSLVVTELMYHPPDPPVGSLFGDDDFEFLEVLNIGERALDLTGFRFTGGIDFTFSGGPMLPPGEYALVVKNLGAFRERYDTTGLLLAGEYTGNLDNDGEIVELEGPLGEPIHLFEFRDSWYQTTDGNGFSLTIVDPLGSLAGWSQKTSWNRSSVRGGTPGADDSAFVRLGGRQLPGDSNQDGVVDLSDAISLLRRLFLGGATPLPCEGGLEEGGNLLLLDLDDDAGVDISDALHLLSFLFRNGPAPAAGTSCIRIEGCPSVCGF